MTNNHHDANNQLFHYIKNVVSHQLVKKKRYLSNETDINHNFKIDSNSLNKSIKLRDKYNVVSTLCMYCTLTGMIF